MRDTVVTVRSIEKNQGETTKKTDIVEGTTEIDMEVAGVETMINTIGKSIEMIVIGVIDPEDLPAGNGEAVLQEDRIIAIANGRIVEIAK